MGLPQIGVEAVVQNVDGYKKSIASMDAANKSAGDSVSHLGNIFDFAIGGVVTNAISGVVNLASQAASTVISFVGDSLGKAREAEAAQRQLNAVLLSTKGIAGVTAKEVNDLADKYSNLTKYSDNDIVSAQNLLLTFTKIGKKTFPDTTKAVLDMATAMKLDLRSASLIVGKAMNDPVAGVTSLQKEGVKLTEQQKQLVAAMVKTGDIAGAQGVILKELQTEFGGSAEAEATPWDILQNKIEKFQEAVGKALTPVFDNIAAALNPLLDKYMPQFIDLLNNQIGPAVSTAATVFGDFFTNLSDGLDPLHALGKALYESGVPQETIDSVMKFGDYLFNTLIPGIANFVSTSASIVSTVWDALSTAATAAGQLPLIIFDTLNKASTAATQLVTIVAGAVKDAYTGVVLFVSGIVQGAVTSVSQLPLIIVNGINNAALAATAIVTGFIAIGQGIISNIVQGIDTTLINVSDAIQAGMSQWGSDLGARLGDFVLAGAAIISNIASGVNATLADVGKAIAGGPPVWIANIQGALGGFVDVGKGIINGIVAGIKANAGAVLASIAGVIADATAAARNLLGIHSPSTVFAGMGENMMRGMQQGILTNMHLPTMAIAASAVNTAQVAAMPIPVGGGSSSYSDSHNTTIYNMGVTPYQPPMDQSNALQLFKG